MRRATTAVLLSGWTGFLAVSAAVPAIGVLHLAEPSFPVPSMLADQVGHLSQVVLVNGNSELVAATVASLAAAMLASLLGLALWLVVRTEEWERRLGERLAFRGLAGIAALVAGVRLSGSSALDAAGSLPSFALILGLSVAALLFDRLLDSVEEEADADDEGFRAALSLIGREMARGPSRTESRDDRHSRSGRV
jgi:hypothetical protein